MQRSEVRGRKSACCGDATCVYFLHRQNWQLARVNMAEFLSMCGARLSEVHPRSSDCIVTGFTRADADALFHGENKDFAIADFAAACASDDGVDRGLDEGVIHADLEA